LASYGPLSGLKPAPAALSSPRWKRWDRIRCRRFALRQTHSSVVPSAWRVSPLRMLQAVTRYLDNWHGNNLPTAWQSVRYLRPRFACRQSCEPNLRTRGWL
jgi:hypothetical protein